MRGRTALRYSASASVALTRSFSSCGRRRAAMSTNSNTRQQSNKQTACGASERASESERACVRACRCVCPPACQSGPVRVCAAAPSIPSRYLLEAQDRALEESKLCLHPLLLLLLFLLSFSLWGCSAAGVAARPGGRRRCQAKARRPRPPTAALEGRRCTSGLPVEYP
jgi:hypothetical protein